MPLYNVFQKGLIRGAERHDPEKAYAYVEHPTEGWRVYLRSCMFLHPEESFHPLHFWVLKRRGAHRTSAAWEPPKGQMEGKELKKNRDVMQCLLANALRETEEEAHINEVRAICHTGLVFQSQEKDYPSHHYFQYHLFQGTISPEQITQSLSTFEWMKEHKQAVAKWKQDRKETDAGAWFHPRNTRLPPRWCPDIVALYVAHYSH